MSDNGSQQQNKLTWAAAIVAVLLLFPGLFVGQIAASIYGYMLRSFIYWMPEIVQTVLITWFGQLLVGMLAGTLAMWLAFLMFKRANKIAVLYALGTFIVFATVLSLASSAAASELLKTDTVGIIASAFGTIAGAYMVARPEG